LFDGGIVLKLWTSWDADFKGSCLSPFAVPQRFPPNFGVEREKKNPPAVIIHHPHKMESDSTSLPSLPELSLEQHPGLLLELEEFAYSLPDINLLELCNSSPNFYGTPPHSKEGLSRRSLTIGSGSRIKHARPCLGNTTLR
jgi:hypothetical protein